MPEEEYFRAQIDLRDKVILALLKLNCESPCEICALKNVCVKGAKFETCAAGVLAAMQANSQEAE